MCVETPGPVSGLQHATSLGSLGFLWLTIAANIVPGSERRWSKWAPASTTERKNFDLPPCHATVELGFLGRPDGKRSTGEQAASSGGVESEKTEDVINLSLGFGATERDKRKTMNICPQAASALI